LAVLTVGSFAMLAVASCGYLLEGLHGSRVSVSVDIWFRSSDPTLIAEVPVYIVEQIGTRNAITEVLNTDAHGHVSVHGYHCLPLWVAIRGANVSLQEASLRNSYEVDVTEPSRSLESLFGKPDSRFMEYSATHADCG
jgi:hypothetical protein